MNNSSGIKDFLMEHSKGNPVSFHMPGHKGSWLYEKYGYGTFLDSFFDYDITEITGADNLFQMEGIIRETMDKYRALYGSRESYILVNGSSSGIIAAILATVPKGGKLILARHCHKSVYNAITLGEIQPVYAYPEVVEEYGIAGPVAPEEIGRLMDEYPEAAAVILPSPNYYGVCSDIKGIAEEVHKRGKVLIVDQAHGAHLKFMDNMGACVKAAEDCGADLVINSIHKTLASLTQSAVLNVCSNRVSLYELENRLQLMESTSPSYILMGSLDINAEILLDHGSELMNQWDLNIRRFSAKAAEIEGLKIMNVFDYMDTTKINLDMSELGLSGHQLEKKLLEYGIFAELTTGNILMCMSGIGNRQSDYDRLLEALSDIAAARGLEMAGKLAEKSDNRDSEISGAALWTKQRQIHEIPERKVLERIDLCEGRICASSIVPYPPGIPLVCPGEEVGKEEIEYIKKLRSNGEKVMGIDAEERIAVDEIG